MLGFASHSPGGLGVFDAAMLVALWQFDKEDLLAGLLLFRLLYYIIPFALSLLILGARELRPERCAARRAGAAARADALDRPASDRNRAPRPRCGPVRQRFAEAVRSSAEAEAPTHDGSHDA